MNPTHRPTERNLSLDQRIREWSESFACRVTQGTPEDPESKTWGFLLEPTDAVQGLFKSTVTWIPDPTNILIIEAKLAIEESVQEFVNNLPDKDIAKILLDSLLYMSLCEEAEYQPVLPEHQDNQVRCPTATIARSFIAVDDTLSRARFYDAFMRVQRSVRATTVFFQRIQLRRELVEGEE